MEHKAHFVNFLPKVVKLAVGTVVAEEYSPAVMVCSSLERVAKV